MKNEPLTKKQRDIQTSIALGFIGSAYVVIADKLGTICGIFTANKTGCDPTIAGAVCSILFSFAVIWVGFHHFKIANKKCRKSKPKT